MFVVVDDDVVLTSTPYIYYFICVSGDHKNKTGSNDSGVAENKNTHVTKSAINLEETVTGKKNPEKQNERTQQSVQQVHSLIVAPRCRKK